MPHGCVVVSGAHVDAACNKAVVLAGVHACMCMVQSQWPSGGAVVGVMLWPAAWRGCVLRVVVRWMQGLSQSENCVVAAG